jgi:hypothetical protein
MPGRQWALDTRADFCRTPNQSILHRGKDPMANPAAPQPDLAWHLRRLLEAVKDACGLEGRWRWLTGPMLLWAWMRTRRERREAAEMMAAFQGLLETLLGAVEDFRAGRLKPEVGEEEERGADRAGTPVLAQGPGPGFRRDDVEKQHDRKGAVAYPHLSAARATPSPSRGEKLTGQTARRRNGFPLARE